MAGAPEPPKRYGSERLGELIHVDVKKAWTDRRAGHGVLGCPSTPAGPRYWLSLALGHRADAARDNRLVVLPGDPQQQRLLEILRQADDQPVTFSELHAAGISFPAAVIGELELEGYVFERVYRRGRPCGVRLERVDRPLSPPRRLRPWRRTQPPR